MLPELTKGALDRIMSGEEVEKPIFQILRYKKLVSSSGDERYRLLMSDGVKSSSFVMLATQLNELITKDVLTKLSIVEIKRYATSIVKKDEIQRRAMVILNIDILVPGHEVGKVIGVEEYKEKEVGSDASCQTNAGPPTRSSDEIKEDGAGTQNII